MPPGASWSQVIHSWITNKKPEECLPAASLAPRGLVTDPQYRMRMCFSNRPFSHLPDMRRASAAERLLFNHHVPARTQTPAGSKDKKAGLTAVVVRVLTAAGKATSFHDLPGKQQAACKAMRQHLTWDDNTLSSSCASDGSPGFTAYKSKQSVSSSTGTVNTEKPKDT